MQLMEHLPARATRQQMIRARMVKVGTSAAWFAGPFINTPSGQRVQ